MITGASARDWRKRHGHTLADVADVIGCSQNYYYRFETGRQPRRATPWLTALTPYVEQDLPIDTPAWSVVPLDCDPPDWLLRLTAERAQLIRFADRAASRIRAIDDEITRRRKWMANDPSRSHG